MTLTEIMAVVGGLFLGYGAVSRLMSGRMGESKAESPPPPNQPPRLQLGAPDFIGETWFEILGVPEDADLETIRRARASLLDQYRPDKLTDLDEALKKLAEARTRQIENAYTQALARRS